MDIKQVNSAIMFGDFDNTELNSIIDAVKFRRASLGKQTIRTLGLGDRVSFHSTKRNQTFQGTVKKVAIKYVTVDTGAGLWKVPANMLSIVD
jgi:hypothetical protein